MIQNFEVWVLYLNYSTTEEKGLIFLQIILLVFLFINNMNCIALLKRLLERKIAFLDSQIDAYARMISGTKKKDLIKKLSLGGISVNDVCARFDTALALNVSTILILFVRKSTTVCCALS